LKGRLLWRYTKLWLRCSDSSISPQAILTIASDRQTLRHHALSMHGCMQLYQKNLARVLKTCSIAAGAAICGGHGGYISYWTNCQTYTEVAKPAALSYLLKRARRFPFLCLFASGDESASLDSASVSLLVLSFFFFKIHTDSVFFRNGPIRSLIDQPLSYG